MSTTSARTVSRRIPTSMQVPIRAYATVIGEVVWASNFAHGAFEILFSHVATPDNYSIGRAIWHTSKSDRGQIEMLVAAAIASDRLSERTRSRIFWATNNALNLAELRNDAVHSATVVLVIDGKQTMSPSDTGTKPKRSERLRREDDLKKKFRVVKGDLLQLGQYVHALWPHLAGFDHLPPLPRKPQLLSLQKPTLRRTTRPPRK